MVNWSQLHDLSHGPKDIMACLPPWTSLELQTLLRGQEGSNFRTGQKYLRGFGLEIELVGGACMPFRYIMEYRKAR